ncbi:hypothetical protein D1007_46649 [Hordeum vulgare]|nr:hypothetical protein D1007_46649 [Hordeum vulgare]
MDMADLNLTPPQEEDGVHENQEEDRLIVMDMADLNLTPPQEEDGVPENQEEDRLIAMDMADLNLIPPQEEDGVPENQEENHQEGDAAGEGVFLDLNFSPPRDHKEAIHEEAAIPVEEAIAQEEAIRRSAMDEPKRVTNTVKPTLKPQNKIKRLKFCIPILDELWISTSRPLFKPMKNIVHIDEKWYDMTRGKNTYYLLSGEPPPVRTVPNTNNIGKVMFLTVVAKTRYNDDGEVRFNGKIGTWAFVEETEAVRTSQNRARGTKELKSVKVTRNVSRDYLINKFIPAIQDKWPHEDEGAKIFIQQDNVKPHVLPNDVYFREAVEQTDLDIQLVQQPPNNPDFNVLDLCFHNSL